MKRSTVDDIKGYDTLMKFLLIGDSSVGKTAMLLRYVDDLFKDDFLSTVGVDFRVKMVERNNRKIKVQIVCLFLFYYHHQKRKKKRELKKY